MPKLDREWYLAQKALVDALENLYAQNEQEATFSYKSIQYRIVVHLDGFTVSPVLAAPLE